VAVKQPIKNLLPQLSHVTLLPLVHKTALEAINANENQISGLIKHSSLVEVEIAVARLLREIFELTLSPATTSQIAAMASKLCSSPTFKLLRFEEIAYALNKGIDGGYGRDNKNLAYQSLADWLTEYMEVERWKAVEEYRIKKHSEVLSEKAVDVAPEIMYQFSRHITKIDEPVKKVDLKEQRLSFFLSFKDRLTDDQLQKEFKENPENELLINAIQDEIKARTQKAEQENEAQK
jgi:hypothetical protein